MISYYKKWVENLILIITFTIGVSLIADGLYGALVVEIKNFEPLEKSMGFTLYENVKNNQCTEEMPKYPFWHVIKNKTRPHHIVINNKFTKNYLTNSRDKIEIVSYLILDRTMVEGKKKMCKNLNKYLDTIKNGLVYEKIQEMIIVENLFIDRLEFLNDSQMLWKKMQLMLQMKLQLLKSWIFISMKIVI